MIVRDALRQGTLGRLDDGIAITMDRGFQGLPDMAHGGSVLALFDGAADLDGPRRVRAHYLKRVPLATPLMLRRVEVEGCARFDLLDAGRTTLVDGEVSPISPSIVPPAVTGRGEPLPLSASCFVCGTDNEIGLRASMTFDDDAVTGTWQPREGFRTPDGAVAPVAITALLDEAAFWLGALATGESGMTTVLDVTLLRPVRFGVPITIAGDRHRVVPRADDPRYLDTAIVALDTGEPVASAKITFVAVRGAARRLSSWLARTNPPEIVRRVFPAYGS